MPPLKVLLASSEVVPFAKTGGLADVSAALARFLARRGHDVRLLLPLYARIRRAHPELAPVPELPRIPVQFGERSVSFSVCSAPLPDSELSVWFVDCPELYDREDLYTSNDDEHLRFALLARAAIATCQYTQWAPDILHCNDWHTALAPLYLKAISAWDKLFERTRSVLTIHNIAYQGVFSSETLDEIAEGVDRGLFFREDVERGAVNFLKTGILYADALTTVSETYAEEIQTEEFGMGLDELLKARRDALFGIVNGVDYGDWNPETDTLIPHHYSADDLAGKARNRTALRSLFELAESRAPLLGVVSRLTFQKGFELLSEILPILLHSGSIQLAVLGSGEEKYEKYFRWLEKTFPNAVGFHCGYSNELAHLIEAGSDLFLMPSRYEPCGLNQMYSLKYGTIPVVRRTGGLADTVEPFDARSGAGTGFVFDEFTSEALLAAVREALEVYRDPATWLQLVHNAMAQDYSWERQGEHYLELYERLRTPVPS